MAVFVVHARQPAQQVDRGLVNQRLGGGGRSVGTDLRHADGCGGFSGGLILLGLQGQEDVGRGVERAAPDDAQLGEVQHQQCDARLQAALADGVLHVLHCLQRERPVLLELDEEDGLLVVSAHRLGLLIQPPALRTQNPAHYTSTHPTRGSMGGMLLASTGADWDSLASSRGRARRAPTWRDWIRSGMAFRSTQMSGVRM
mmetsp:Transcript_45226/g.117153  ORF Transcript_45226/g.117153 Transcript_45226/m.117153 type:complete len:200 (+) Transcript_45226:379-978(+)